MGHIPDLLRRRRFSWRRYDSQVFQMGMTKSRRYANHKGGRKYCKDGVVLEKWIGEDISGQTKEKEAAIKDFQGILVDIRAT